MKKTTVPRRAVMFRNELPGIAISGYFASSAWLESEEAFDGIVGRKFGWYDFQDQTKYCNDKGDFRLMTEEEYKKYKQLFDKYDNRSYDELTFSEKMNIKLRERLANA
jgi:hypothetical protein